MESISGFLTATYPMTVAGAFVSPYVNRQRVAVQRLLIAIAVVLAPVCSNLPCCCKRAAASEASSCKKPETTTSCCQRRSQKDSEAAGSSGHEKKSSPESSPESSLKLSSCECCIHATTPETVVTAVPRAVAKPKCNSLVAALQVESSVAFPSLQITAEKNSPQFSAGKHNRPQAMLCVWRN